MGRSGQEYFLAHVATLAGACVCAGVLTSAALSSSLCRAGYSPRLLAGPVPPRKTHAMAALLNSYFLHTS